ncbi:MAG TPA: hypothetical protein PK718_07870 [Candidatus Methanofastidiosa archaeon]|nr:hypothetical protein [Candidatus Methanofastidiosa archaeon]
MDPNDNNGRGSGDAPFTRNYDEGTQVTLEAAEYGDNVFDHWEKNGSFYSNNAAITFTVTSECTFKAWYQSSNTDPNEPYNESPSDGATNVPIDQILSWSCSDPDGDSLTYNVFLEANDSSPDVEVANGITSSHYNPDLEYGTHYYWRITARDGYGFSHSEVWDFWTEDEPEAYDIDVESDVYQATIWVDPNDNNGRGSGDAPFTRNYDEGTQVTLEAAEYGDNVFDHWEKNGSFYSNNAAITFTVTSECTFKAWYQSSNTDPNEPYNESPSDGATNVPIDQILSWSCSDPDGDSLTYNVFLEANDSSPDVEVANGITSSHYNPDLEYGTHYYWRITARDGYGFSHSEVWDFWTEDEPDEPNQSPNTPYNPSPGDGVTNVSVNANLTWGCTDPDGDSLTFDIWLEANDHTPDNQVANNITSFSFNPDLDYGTHYYWQVLAQDGEGNKISAVWDFWTEDEPTTLTTTPSPITNPPENTFYSQVVEFLKNDQTDKNEYDEGFKGIIDEYVCRHFAADIYKNAKKCGIELSIVLIYTIDFKPGHAMNAFNYEEEWYFIEPQTDTIFSEDEFEFYITCFDLDHYRIFSGLMADIIAELWDIS